MRGIDFGVDGKERGALRLGGRRRRRLCGRRCTPRLCICVAEELSTSAGHRALILIELRLRLRLPLWLMLWPWLP